VPQRLVQLTTTEFMPGERASGSGRRPQRNGMDSQQPHVPTRIGTRSDEAQERDAPPPQLPAVWAFGG